MVPSPSAPGVDVFCERLSCQRRQERCFYQLSSSCSRDPQEELQLAAAQPGCAAVGGPNYRRVCPSREAEATIGWRGSFERTEKLFARLGRSALGAPGAGRRGGFTIRFSFFPDHIDRFAQFTGHCDLGLAFVGTATVGQTVVKTTQIGRTRFALDDTGGSFDEGPSQRVIASMSNVPSALVIGRISRQRCEATVARQVATARETLC